LFIKTKQKPVHVQMHNVGSQLLPALLIWTPSKSFVGINVI